MKKRILLHKATQDATHFEPRVELFQHGMLVVETKSIFWVNVKSPKNKKKKKWRIRK